MNICILSMQRVNNYGSLLQSYSLKKTIESLGHKVYFIDIKKGHNENLNIICNQSYSNLSQGDKNWIATQILRIKNKFSSLDMKKKFEEFRINDLQIESNHCDKGYDICVIGSDEVFNCLQKSKWGFDPQLFGEVKAAKKSITYAASCGSTKAEMLPEELKAAISKAMTNLSAISVRDENTALFVQALTGREVVYHLDPVAIGDFSNEIQNVHLENKLPAHYCLIYSYQGRMNDENTKEKILAYCKKNKLTPVAPFGKQNWIKPQKVLSPFELLKAFVNADSIITDTFHGTLFGAKFGKRMAIIIRDSNKNKLNDLTMRLGLENHVLTDINNLSNVLNKELNRTSIDEILVSERKRTLNYLRSSL